ncbi:MAG TPA: hypothetical protein ENG73_01170 [Desulfobacterales bacterium]|nr:hypothetical protein [Desulfobacterales bacterium]
METEFVMHNNRQIMGQYTFRQKAIDAIAEPDTSVEVLGVKLRTPVIMSAMTMPIPAIAEDGLLKVARALKDAGSLMWTGSPIPADLKALKATGVPLAANVKPLKERKKIYEALELMQEAEVDWIGIEIDSGQGTKVLDRQRVFDCSPLSFPELQEIRKAVTLPLIFKGILSKEDAVKSVKAGADGIVISNHGAHTLDYLPHPFQVMKEITEQVTGNTVIMVDGGFRRGNDVLKGLAFGTSLVGLGRPILYGLAADGEQGVRDVINAITAEFKRLMSIVGVKDVRHVEGNILINQVSCQPFP